MHQRLCFDSWDIPTFCRSHAINMNISLFAACRLSWSISSTMFLAHTHPFAIYVFRISVLFCTLINMASSAAINLPQRNLTTSLSANGNQCTDNATWIGTGSTAVDCIGAVQRLYDSEVKTFSDIDFEFLSGRAPRRSLPSMRTPRKYTHGRATDVFPQS